MSDLDLQAIRQRADMYDPDFAFIAHAREDVPALLDEIERLSRRLRRAEQLLKIYPDLKGHCSTGRYRCKGHAG